MPAPADGPAEDATDGGVASEGNPTADVPLFVPPGHFYSPIPVPSDVADEADARVRETTEIPGVDLRTDAQLERARRFFEFLRHYDPPAERGASQRYHHANDFYPFGDAAALSFMVATHRPARAVEIGSGYSTAALLDARDRCNAQASNGSGGEGVLDSVRCIEPFPDRLRDLMRPEDHDVVQIDTCTLQASNLEWVEQLEAGDLLIVDSSHVLKTGSDVWWLFDRVLPRLRTGVLVHFHDVCWPFEYPHQWIEEGRAWNEAYALRLFLQYNTAFAVHFYPSYIVRLEPQRLLAALDLGEGDLESGAGLPAGRLERLTSAIGSSCWIERVR